MSRKFFGLLNLGNDNKKKMQELDAEFEDQLKGAPGFVSLERKTFGFVSTYQIKTTEPSHAYYKHLREFQGICVKILKE